MRRRRGQVLVEFAVALPLLVGLVFFLVEAGFFVNAKQGLQVALREGAVLVAERSVNGVVGEADRQMALEAMRVALRRPGVVDPEARLTVERRGPASVVRLVAEASYQGLTPLALAFEGAPLRADLTVELGALPEVAP